MIRRAAFRFGPLPLARAACCAALAATAAPGAAQGACPRVGGGGTPWPAPLDRVVTLRAREIPLRDALDRLSAGGRVALSYSPDAVPLDRRVCLTAERVPLGAALAALLSGTPVEARVVARQVVLAPARTGAASPAPAAGGHPPQPRPLLERPRVLEEIVVTGSPAGGPRRELSVALDALDGARLLRQSASTLGEAINGSVPGVWVWSESPASVLTQYGSVRGASSFGATYPKVYLDGVEVANPMLVAELDPESIERVEVIRGPQGSALYGSDAISGVINIVTRHPALAGGARPELDSRAGPAGSTYATSPLTRHEHRLGLRGGTNTGSGAVAATLRGTGEVYPEAASRSVGATAGARWVLPSAILSATGRFSDRRAGLGSNPLLLAADSTLQLPADSLQQRVTHVTLSGAANLSTGSRWTHTLVLGVDGYGLDLAEAAAGPFPVLLDSAFALTHGSGVRVTGRASTTMRVGSPAGAAAALTLAGEHSALRQTTRRPRPSREAQEEEIRRTDSGLMGQLNASWQERAYLTSGVRLQRSTVLSDADLTLLPMIGVAWVEEVGRTDLKLRGAYGRGIRPPYGTSRAHLGLHWAEVSSDLQPEVQSGVELGADVYVADVLSLSATRFDQRASGLIQDVVIGIDSSLVHRGRRIRRIMYQAQNVGGIENRGWEAQAGLTLGGLTLTAATAVVDSRVTRLAPRYRGDLRPGDRMLGVPGRTASVGGAWTGERWSAAVGVARAWDWINYDRLALTRALAAAGVPPQAFNGPKLRSFWRRYEGSTDVRATVWRRVRPGVWLTATGENLLGAQLGEPDNATIRPGRVLMVGVRAGF